MARWPVPLLALALAGALAACSGQDDAARPASTVTYTAGDVPVLVPGEPGEPATVLQPGESGTMANPDAYRDADVTFVTDMVAHHTQALQMAALAPDRAQDERVLRLAERIAAGQGPEIEVMQAWLAAHGLPPADEHADQGAHTMPGMAEPEQIERLQTSRGTAFDRMFLEMMTAHHEGALTMADQAVGAGHPLVVDLVDDTVATQSVEISRMQQVLADLPA